MDDLFPLSDYAIRVLGMTGSWLAGIGSLAAVIVSLWLSRRNEKLRLSVKLTINSFKVTDVDMQGRFEFSIVNTGFRTITVENCGLRRRRWFRSRNYFPINFPGRGLPRKIDPGDHATIEIDARFELYDWVRVLQSRSRVSVVVLTAMGQVTAPTNPVLRELLRAFDVPNPRTQTSAVKSD